MFNKHLSVELYLDIQQVVSWLYASMLHADSTETHWCARVCMCLCVFFSILSHSKRSKYIKASHDVLTAWHGTKKNEITHKSSMVNAQLIYYTNVILLIDWVRMIFDLMWGDFSALPFFLSSRISLYSHQMCCVCVRQPIEYGNFLNHAHSAPCIFLLFVSLLFRWLVELFSGECLFLFFLL